MEIGEGEWCRERETDRQTEKPVELQEIRAVPLVHNERRRFEEFTVHFLIPKEEENKAKLLEEYFNLIEIPVQGLEFGTTHLIKAARLDEGNLPEDLNLVEDYYQLVNHEYKRWQQNPTESNRPARNQIRMNNAAYLGSLIEEKCATYGCLFYCSVETKPYCHECFEQAKSMKMDGNMKNREQQQKKKGCCPPRTELVITATTPTEPERSSRPRSAPPTAPSLSLFSETNAMKCKVPNCPFTLNVQHNGLCERCFKTRRAVPGNTTDNRTAEKGRATYIPEELKEGFQPCKNSGCHYFGTKEHEGYCTICFIEYRRNLGCLKELGP
eukprot:g38494.t1